jgi:hypothetical protein
VVASCGDDGGGDGGGGGGGGGSGGVFDKWWFMGVWVVGCGG